MVSDPNYSQPVIVVFYTIKVETFETVSHQELIYPPSHKTHLNGPHVKAKCLPKTPLLPVDSVGVKKNSSP